MMLAAQHFWQGRLAAPFTICTEHLYPVWLIYTKI